MELLHKARRLLSLKLLFNHFFIFILASLSVIVHAEASKPYIALTEAPQLKVSQAELILAEQILSNFSFSEKGYANKELIDNSLRGIKKYSHFNIFQDWLTQTKKIDEFQLTPDLITFCRGIPKNEGLPAFEKMLSHQAAKFCRAKALELISRDLEKSSQLSVEALAFIKDDMKYYLDPELRENFAFFLRQQSQKSEVLRTLSQEVTLYSVQHSIVPSQEVLKDLVITEQLTQLVQVQGINNVASGNVFYGEFGKMIEKAYKELDPKSDEALFKKHYEGIKNYFELNQDYLPVGRCLVRIGDLAKTYWRYGQVDLSRKMFLSIIKKNNKEVMEDAQFSYLWTYLHPGDYKETIKQAESLGLIKNFYGLTDSRLKFWIAYAFQERDEKKDAIKFYENIITAHPLSYYAIMSVKRLNQLKSDSPQIKFFSSPEVLTQSPPSLNIEMLDGDSISSLIRLKVWAKLNAKKFMNLEVQRLHHHSLPNLQSRFNLDKMLQLRSDIHFLTSGLIAQNQDYLSSFKYLYEALDKKEILFNRQLLEMLYPTPYFNDLKATLKKAEIDPIIVLSLIRQESVFNPEARSPVGARGLMQLMPATARRFQRSVRDKQLVQPKRNMEIGTKYFQQLMKRFDGNLVYVLASYNAGENRVDRWKGTYFNEEETILKNIEMIPFLETRNYVKLIFRNIFFYKLLLEGGEQQVTPELNRIYNVALGFKR